MPTTRGPYESHNANGFETRLTSQAGALDTTFYLQTTAGLSSPFYMVIDPDDNSSREYIFVDGNVSATNVVTSTIDNRYLTGSAETSNLTHTSGTVVRIAPTKQHFEDIWEAIDKVVDTDFSSATKGEVSIDPSAEVVDVANDEILFKDSSASGALKKETISDLVSGIASTGLSATSGQLSVSSPEETVDVANDSIVFVDNSDSDNLKKDTIVDIVGGIAGDGLVAQSDGTLDVEIRTTEFHANALTTATETLHNNNNDASVPTNRAVIEYVTDQELTLSGKTLKDYAETKQTLTSSSGVLSIDLANGNTGTITLSENITDIDFTNVPTSGVSTFTLQVTQDSTARTVAINAVTVNSGSDVTALTPGGGGYTASTGSGDIDLLTFMFVDAGTPLLNSLQDFS